MVEVNLAELPLEILERIVAELDPDEVSASVSKISRRFAEVSYNVLCKRPPVAVSTKLDRIYFNDSTRKQLTVKIVIKEHRRDCEIFTLLENRATQETNLSQETTVKKLIFLDRFRELQGPILERLLESKENLERLSSVPTNFEEEMLQVSNFTFYQILHSEYKILCTIYFNRRSVEHSALVFHGVRSLKEFNKLLYGNSSNFQDDNVSSLLDSLRCCNSELLQYFFCKVWNVEKDYMGTLVVRLLNCSVCATFDLEVSHEQLPKSRNSKCHISGKFEITDLSNTLSSPPDGLQDFNSEKAKKVFVAYVCDAIRWGNLFHTLRLRWICLDKALVIGRRQQPGWPRMDPSNPYESSEEEKMSVEESLHSVHNGDYKTIRRLKKVSKIPPSVMLSWMGTRVELQLWCRAMDVPEEMLSEEYRNALQNQPGEAEEEEDPSTWPYHFKLKYSANVRALASSNQGLVKTTIIVKETPELTNIRQIKTIITA